MANYNRVILGGNLTTDPELRFTNSGKAVCDFSLAINRGRKNKDTADYFRVTAWEELAETVANYKEKGHPVLVDGRLQYSAWENAEGQKRSRVEVVAENIGYLGNKGSASGSANGAASASKSASANGSSSGDVSTATAVADDDEDFDDIPF
jgi:single-strand DNA-binding protein